MARDMSHLEPPVLLRAPLAAPRPRHTIRLSAMVMCRSAVSCRLVVLVVCIR
jgi:hypothetical protein